MKKTVFILFVLVITQLLFCSVNGYYQNPNLCFPGLINPDKIQINHSLSFFSGFSSSGTGYYSNIYTNHILFNLRNNLDLKLNLHFINDGSMNFDQDYDINWNNDNASHIIPEFQLEWRPTDNTTLRIEFEQKRFSPWSNSFFYNNDPFGDD